MKLLEASGLKKWFVGEAQCPANVADLFCRAIGNGVRELELTEIELGSFIRAYAYDKIPIDQNLVDGDFNFWGVHITKLKDK